MESTVGQMADETWAELGVRPPRDRAMALQVTRRPARGRRRGPVRRRALWRHVAAGTPR